MVLQQEERLSYYFIVILSVVCIVGILHSLTIHVLLLLFILLYLLHNEWLWCDQTCKFAMQIWHWATYHTVVLTNWFSSRLTQSSVCLSGTGRASLLPPHGNCGLCRMASCWQHSGWPGCFQVLLCSCLDAICILPAATPPPGSSCLATASPTSNTAMQRKTPSTEVPSATFGTSSACVGLWLGRECTPSSEQVQRDWLLTMDVNGRHCFL